MPKNHAMDFDGGVWPWAWEADAAEGPCRNGVRAAELVNDYLEREKVEKPSDTHQLLFFLATVHLYPEELSTIAEYLRNRQDHLQDAATHNHSPHPLRPVMPHFLRGRRCCLHRCYPPPQALKAERHPLGWESTLLPPT